MSNMNLLKELLLVVAIIAVGMSNGIANTTSPFEPPEKDLGVFVVNSGSGLDTGCTSRGGGPLVIKIPIPAVVNPSKIDANGKLIDVNELIANGIIGKNAIIRFPVFDIDDKADIEDGAPEIDKLSFNDEFQHNLAGANDTWTDDSIVIPIEKLKFNQPGQTNVVNELKIDIDTGNASSGEELWCMAVDWVSIEFELAAPYVLAHGIDADRSTWEEATAPGVLNTLDNMGVRYERFSVLANGRSSQNAKMLKTKITTFLENVNSKKVHIIAHSKGGLDSQYLQHIEHDFEILSLSTLSTPHLGSVAGDATIIKLEDADELIENGTDPNGHVKAFLNNLGGKDKGPQNPGVKDLTTYEANNAIASGLRGNISKTFTIGADADVDGNNELTISEDDGLFPGYGHWYADESWNLMRNVSSVVVVSSTEVKGTFWGTNKTVTYKSTQTTVPQANDIVVTVNSANPTSYGTSLLQADQANHGTVKNAANIQRILTKTIPLK